MCGCAGRCVCVCVDMDTCPLGRRLTRQVLTGEWCVIRCCSALIGLDLFACSGRLPDGGSSNMRQQTEGGNKQQAAAIGELFVGDDFAMNPWQLQCASLLDKCGNDGNYSATQQHMLTLRGACATRCQ